MEEKKTWGNWLAIASFVLALVGGFLCLTIIGGVLWIICFVLSLIFGIIALCKKQTARAAISGMAISLVAICCVAILTLNVGRFVVNHKDELISPITQFSNWVDENPDLVELMKDEEFSAKFETAFKAKMQEKYWEDYENVNSVDWALNIWGDVFEEMQNTLLELASQEMYSDSNINGSIILDETIYEEDLAQDVVMDEIVGEVVEEVVE